MQTIHNCKYIVPSAGTGSGKKCKLSKTVCGRRIGVQILHDAS
jgi:hypothetical protein